MGVTVRHILTVIPWNRPRAGNRCELSIALVERDGSSFAELRDESDGETLLIDPEALPAVADALREAWEIFCKRGAA